MFGSKLETQVQAIVEKAGFEVPSSKEHARRIQKKIPGNPQIDVMGWDEDFFLAIECTGKQELGRKSLKARVSEVADETRDIRKWWRMEQGPHATVRTVLATRNITVSENLRTQAQRKGVAVWDDDVLDHYWKTAGSLGRWTRYEIMWSLGFRRELGTDPIRIDGAVEMRQKGIRISIFPISPEKLLKIAFVFRRDPSYPAGYQRIVQTKKLQDIREYLTKGKGLVPNSIILNLGRGTKFKAYAGFSSDGVRVGQLSIPPIPCSAWVIDGQHRLMAFSSNAMSRLSKKFRLCAVAFHGLRRDRQARLFLTINETQKRVSAGLRAELASELYPSEPRGAAALIVKELSFKSPFRGLIAVKPWERKKLKLANFADSLIRSGVIPRAKKRITKNERNKIVELVRTFFSTTSDEVQVKEAREFIFGNNGVAVLLRILSRSRDCSGGRLRQRYVREVVLSIKSFPWRRSLQESVYSSEGDRLKLAERLMRRIANRCRWFSLPPTSKRRER